MVDLKSFTRWNVDLAKTIAAIGDDTFFSQLFSALGAQVQHEYPQIWLYHRDLPPRILYHEIPKQAVALQVDRYLEGPYREDPFYQLSMSSPRNSIYRLARLTGTRFEESSYFRDYYEATDTRDEIIFLTRLDDGSVINFCIMRLNGQRDFHKDEYDLLYTLAEPIAAAIKSHCHRDDFEVTNLLQPAWDAQIDLAFIKRPPIKKGLKRVVNLYTLLISNDATLAMLPVPKKAALMRTRNIAACLMSPGSNLRRCDTDMNVSSPFFPL